MKKHTLKRILALVGKYPFSLLAVILFAAAEVAATLYVPVLVGDGVDLIVGKGNVNFEELKIVFYKIGGAISVGFVAKWLVGIFNNRLAFRTVQEIRNKAFDKINALPLKYLDSHPHGDTLSRVVADADEVSDGLVMGFTQLFTGVLTIGGTIALMLLTNWKIALVVIFVTPLSIFTSRFIAKRTYSYFRAQTIARSEQVSFTEEAVSNLKTAQAFCHEKENEADFEKKNAAYKSAAMSATFSSSLVNPLTRFVNNAVYALVVLFGALQIAKGGSGAAAAAAVRRDAGARLLARGRECSRACWRLLARPVTPLSDERVRATWPRTDARCFARAIGVLLARDPRRRSEFATPAVFCLLAQVLRGHTCADIAQYYYYCKARHCTPWEHPPSASPAAAAALMFDASSTAPAADSAGAAAEEGEEGAAAAGAAAGAELPGAPPVPARLAHTEVQCDLNALDFFVPCVHSGPCTSVCVPWLPTAACVCAA